MRTRNRVIGVVAVAAASLSSGVVMASTAAAEGTSGICTIQVVNDPGSGKTHGVKFDWYAFPRTMYPNPATWNVFAKRDVFNADWRSRYSFSSFYALLYNLKTGLYQENTYRLIGVYSSVPSSLTFTTWREDDFGTDGTKACNAA